MGALLKFMLSLAAHVAWQRMGQRGAVPPMRMKGKTTSLPKIAPWQMMIATFAIKQLWDLFGHEVKGRLDNARHPVVNRFGSMLPRPTRPLSPKNNATSTAPSGSTASSKSTASPSKTPPDYNTQMLPSQISPAQSASKLPSGSVLSSLRDSTA